MIHVHYCAISKKEYVRVHVPWVCFCSVMSRTIVALLPVITGAMHLNHCFYWLILHSAAQAMVSGVFICLDLFLLLQIV